MINSQKIHLSIHDCELLVNMLKAGVPIEQAFQLLPSDTNRILAQLQEGKEIIQILSQSKQRHLQYVCFFLHFCDCASAFEIALQIDKFERDLLTNMIKKASYPSVLFFVSFAMIHLFTNIIIPQLLQTFAMFSHDQQLLFFLFILKWVANGYLACFSFTFLLFIGLRLNPRFTNYFFYHCARYSAFLRGYCSYLFAGYMLQLAKHGVSTIDTLHFLSDAPTFWLGILAKRMDTQLQHGQPLLDVIQAEPLLSKAFYQAMYMQTYTLQQETSLELFILQEETMFSYRLKRLGTLLLLNAYIFVGCIVIVVVQLMFLPLQLISTF